MEIEGLPVIEVDESEQITVAVRADDLLEGDMADPKQHPIAIALRRQDDVDDAQVTKNETLVVARSGFAMMPRTSGCSNNCKRH
jgi:thiazole synthase ThiGH ThiG subunit